MLVRQESRTVNAEDAQDQAARPLPQQLPGTWPGEMTITRYWVSPNIEKKTREGCVVKGMQNNLNKPILIAMRFDQIDLRGAPGVGGRGGHGSGGGKTKYPGEATLVLYRRKDITPRKPSKPWEAAMIFSYDYPERHIRLEGKANRSLVMGGKFYQNATHNSIRGTFKLTKLDKMGNEQAWARGTWWVTKPKQGRTASRKTPGKG